MVNFRGRLRRLRRGAWIWLLGTFTAAGLAVVYIAVVPTGQTLPVGSKATPLTLTVFSSAGLLPEVQAQETSTAGKQVVKAGSAELKLSEHAVQRMEQRGVNIEQVQAVVAGNKPFRYFHEGVWKTGYYDPTTKIFVGSVNNVITTVITNVKPRYIQNLTGKLP